MPATKDIDQKQFSTRKRRKSSGRSRRTSKSSGRSRQSSRRNKREEKSHAISSKQAKAEFNKLKGEDDTMVIAKGFFITLFVIALIVIIVIGIQSMK